MHDIRAIRDNPAAFDRGLESRGLAPLAAALTALDDARKAAIAAAQGAQERRNALSREIGAAKKARDEAAAQGLMAEVARLKEEAPALDAAADAAGRTLAERLAAIPNLPAPDVPVGRDEHDNVEVRRFAGRGLAAEGRQHFELGEAAGLMDFEAAARLSGSRFVVIKGALARLERALGQFMLDLHTGEHGYTEVAPPLLVRDEAMFGTAQLPKFRDDQFAALQGSPEIARESGAPSRWLIPTAEVPLTNLVRESILAEDALPLRFTALTPCFRAEAGAAGRDTRGMLRQHQFNKVELVSITAPERAAEEHERMLACAEAVLTRLDLPYRVVTLCTGDMGFAARKTYDIEVWLPGQQAYREISSCSVCGDFQARRMEARYRPREGRGVAHVHTLNGSGVAVGRALIAVMENYQNPDGSIAVPPALVRHMGGLTRIEGPVS
ncbi:Serine--tRNA ligase [Methylobacterium crusticola]|uniref:Serine--tRNA ligase n=1 Tax=Methylobacterium crusticola TaxID=1697972 RepID=A0ABQ4R6Z4_9HYPH|nr:serine--tRNA ligase [Methylobacterium crusticola]GJD53192.1 Serine--tRNA ligase [Methylobacterium crusticola]